MNNLSCRKPYRITSLLFCIFFCSFAVISSARAAGTAAQEQPELSSGDKAEKIDPTVRLSDGVFRRPKAYNYASLTYYAGNLNSPAGIIFDSAGNLYVANFGSDSVDKITPAGERTIVYRGSGSDGPSGIIIDNTGDLYISNYLSGTIIRVSKEGKKTLIADGFDRPYALAFGSPGKIFVSERGQASVICIDLYPEDR